MKRLLTVAFIWGCASGAQAGLIFKDLVAIGVEDVVVAGTSYTFDFVGGTYLSANSGTPLYNGTFAQQAAAGIAAMVGFTNADHIEGCTETTTLSCQIALPYSSTGTFVQMYGAWVVEASFLSGAATSLQTNVTGGISMNRTWAVLRVAEVNEPATLALLLLGIGGWAFSRIRQGRSAAGR